MQFQQPTNAKVKVMKNSTYTKNMKDSTHFFSMKLKSMLSSIKTILLPTSKQNSPSHSRGWKLLGVLPLVLISILLGGNAWGQISYSQNWSATGLNSWTSQNGTFARTTVAVCATTGSVRANIYNTNATGNFASPLLSGNNGGLVTVSYLYKVTNYSGGAATPNTFGTLKVQYANALAGPWSDVPSSTVNSSNHNPSTSCATKVVQFTPALGNVYIRFNVAWSTGDYYMYFDDVSISQGSAPVNPEPTNQVTALAAGAVTTTAIPLTWTAAATGTQAPAGYLVKASATNLATIADPVDGTDPADVTAFTSGSANKKQTTGAATSTTSFTSMTAGTMYYYKVYSYTNSGSSINFKTGSPATLNHATLPNAATAAGFTSTTGTSTVISWTAPVSYSSANHSTLVFIKSGSAVTVGTPTNAPSTYTANTVFGSGTAYQGDANARCVYNGDANTVTVTGLSASTTYHIYILSVVDAGNSNGTRSYSAGLTGNFTTPCAAASLPWSEGFETGYTNASTIAGCWTQSSVTGAATWMANSSATDYNRTPRTGSFNATLYYSNEDWLFYPVQLTGGTNYTFDVYARQDMATSTDANITLAYGTAASAASMTNTVLAASGIVNGSYQLKTGTFTPSSTGVYYVGIKGYMNGTPFYISIDDIAVYVSPACAAQPSSLSSTAITGTTATISWTAASPAPASGYEYYVSTSSTAPTAGTSATGTVGAGVTTASLTGLTAQTPYYFWVRSKCNGTDKSNWAGSGTFTTPCAAASLPWSEGFETGYTNASTIAGCWSQSSISGTDTWMANSTQTTYNRTARTGSFNATLYYSNEDWLFYPVQLTGGTNYTFDVYARQDMATSTDANITLAYGTAASAASMTNTVLAASGIVDGSYQLKTGTFTPSSTGVYYVGIKGYMNGTPYYISIDDIAVYVTPACAAQPSSLSSTAITGTTATISWTAASPAPASGYEYYVSTSSTAPTAGTNATGTVGAGVTTASLTGLTAQTPYYFWVRSKCNGTDKSSWVGSSSFTTTVDCSNITTFYSKSTGNLNLVASWGSNSDGTGCSPANFTTAGITYVIQNNLSPATSAEWTVTGAGSVVKFGNSSAAVTFTAGANLIYNCDLEITGNATLNLNTRNMTLSGDFVRSASTAGFSQTAGSASTVTFSGSSQEVNVTAFNGTTPTDSDITFNHVVIDGTNVKLFYFKTNDRKLNINNFTVNSGKVVTLYSNPQ
jgi:hypothetical protein